MGVVEIGGRKYTTTKRLDRVTDVWFKLSVEKCGPPGIPVTIKSRNELGIFKHLSAVSTAFPYTDGEIVCLVVALDETAIFDEFTVAHEITHWILNLEGFVTYKDHEAPNNDCQLMLGSVLSHVNVNARLKRYGFDYLSQVDALAQSVGRAIRRRTAWNLPKAELIAKALLCVDILLNCSPARNRDLQEAIAPREALSNIVSNSLSVLSHYALDDLEGNKRAGRMLIRSLGLSTLGTYMEFAVVPELRDMLRKKSRET